VTGQGGAPAGTSSSQWRKPPPGAAQILVVLAFTNLAAYAARNGLVNVYPDLRARYGLGDDDLGLLATAFIVPHAIATLIFGWGGDRYDRRRVITFGMLVASLAGAAGALAGNTTTLMLSRILVGFGAAAVVPIANSILGQIYEGPAKASRMSIFNLGLLVGSAGGAMVGVKVGFPAVVVVLAIPGVILALWVLVLPVPPHPAPRAPEPLMTYLAHLGRMLISEARVLLKIRTLRYLMISTTAMAFAAGGYAVWLIDFLERDKGMTKTHATELLGAALVGAVAGVLAGARVADRLRRRTPAGRLWACVLGMSLTLPCTIACLQLPDGWAMYSVGVLTLFFISWYHAPVAVSVDDVAPAEKTVAAQGLVIFTMHLIGTAPSSYVIGLVSKYSSLYIAMWVPVGGIVIAALAMAAAAPSFAQDAAAARGKR
jgi:MFS family permease